MLAKLQERYGLTSFTLKVIGIILMVSDHIHQMFAYVGAPEWMTMVGRVVAPIFLFLAAEGFHYTHSRIGYMRNLLIGFWITSVMEVILQTQLPNEHVVLMNAIFGTLFLGVMVMWIWDGLKHPIANKKAFAWSMLGIIYLIGSTALMAVMLSFAATGNVLPMRIYMVAVPNLMNIEGGVVFLLLALIFHIFREKRAVALLLCSAFSLWMLFQSAQHGYSDIQWLMIFAVPLLALYNGKQGRKDKWFFYIFYPSHLAVLYIISTVFFNK